MRGGSRTCLGFDLRLNPKDPIAIASKLDCIASGQILNENALDLLSADPLVWPRGHAVENMLAAKDAMNPVGIFSALESALEDPGFRKDSSRSIQVSFTIESMGFIALEQRFGPGMLGSEVKEEELLRGGWHRKGFDAVDIMGMTSGLSGCGYSPATKGRIKGLFLNHINRHGLFRSARCAREFAELRGLQIRDHAPFVVVGVLTKRLTVNPGDGVP